MAARRRNTALHYDAMFHRAILVDALLSRKNAVRRVRRELCAADYPHFRADRPKRPDKRQLDIFLRS
jgi:hypothetical protein